MRALGRRSRLEMKDDFFDSAFLLSSLADFVTEIHFGRERVEHVNALIEFRLSVMFTLAAIPLFTLAAIPLLPS